MTDKDMPPFATLMGRIAEVFQFPLSPTITDEYFKALAKYPLRQVVYAGEQCIVDCLFFPKPKEFIGAMFAERNEGASEYQRKPLALPEYRDPEAFAAWKQEWREVVAKLSDKLAMPAVRVDRDCETPYAEIAKRESWLMTEKHWRARWDLARLSPDMAFLRDQIPDHYRIQFAEEDRAA